MSIKALPGYSRRDVVVVYPVITVPPADPDVDRPTQRLGTPFEVLSQPVDLATQRAEDRQSQDVSFTLWATWKRGTPLPINVNHRLWHPEASGFLSDGARDMETSLNVDNVTYNKFDGICQIQCGRQDA